MAMNVIWYGSLAWSCRPPKVLAIVLGTLLATQTAGLSALAQSPAQHEAASSQRESAGYPASTAIASAAHSSDLLPSAPEPQPFVQEAQQHPAQQQPPPQQQQNPPQQPVGTAAAPYEEPTGVPGSRPAGAVIAPAKQKRVRSIVIRVGLLLAGGAAIGTVVGLSRASHSQP